MSIKTAGIACENWKLPIFKRVLSKRGFMISDQHQLPKGILLLKIKTANQKKLQKAVEEAQRVCAAEKAQKN
jgi:hypothetical protein